jgi:hypothetical protein
MRPPCTQRAAPRPASPPLPPRLPQACLPKAGSELTISYGDKSNEELLMLYGFATQNNPNDQLMIPCPLPPRQEWPDETVGRLRLLQARGLRPQLFLSASRLAALQEGAPGRERGSALDGDARRVLEAFVMSPAELAARLDALERGGGGGGGDDDDEEWPAGGGEGRPAGSGAGAGARAAAAARVERLGAEMALITTLVRLLELKVVELEGEEEGTGPLEGDEVRLEEQGGGRLAPWLRSCLLYRAGQKRLARGWLAAARRELQETLGALRAAEEAERGTGEAEDTSGVAPVAAAAATAG